MTSPLAQFVNARILWAAAGARSSGRDGFKPTKGQNYLIEAFLKQGRPDNPDRIGLPGIGGEERIFSGYAVSYAPISEAEAADFENLDVEGLATVDTTGTLPPGLNHDTKAKLSIKGFGLIEVRFAVVSNAYGQEGIGEIIRDVLGDRIVLDGGQA